MINWTHPIQNYWASKGTDVIYNALGGTDQLVDSYINTFSEIVGNIKGKGSNQVKNICYNSLYTMENIDRVKYTGFENVVQKDKKFRQKITPLIKNLQFNQYVHKESNSHKFSYKAALLQRVKEFNDCYLYFSGGIDSELVAMAMLDAGVKFTPVIFKIIEDGTCKNIHDIQFAYRFCSKYGLHAITESIDIDDVWQDQRFQDMAVELGIASPQIVTHSHFVGVIASKYPKKKHVFGGEVRYYIDNTGEKSANFVQLAKVDPVGYSGQSYEHTILFVQPSLVIIELRYSATTGQWSVIGNPGGVNYGSGTWTTTPAVVYEYRITAISFAENPPTAGGYLPTGPVPTAWTTLTGPTTNIICRTGVDDFSPASFATTDFTIEVRKVGTTSPVVTSTITLTAMWEA